MAREACSPTFVSLWVSTSLLGGVDGRVSLSLPSGVDGRVSLSLLSGVDGKAVFTTVLGVQVAHETSPRTHSWCNHVHGWHGSLGIHI